MAIDNVDGALIGGASLKADDFLAIAGVYEAI
jgi:triosephosphate isomerase